MRSRKQKGTRQPKHFQKIFRETQLAAAFLLLRKRATLREAIRARPAFRRRFPKWNSDVFCFQFDRNT
jgi:hypothetical protein